MMDRDSGSFMADYLKVFLWFVAHYVVMTNEVRWRRRIASNPYCSHCSTKVETLLHALRDCPKARKVW
jgi:hypothetical protein